MTKKQSPRPAATGGHSRRTPLWLAILMPIAAILIFFALLEGGLTLVGFKPALQTEDPFVGFSAQVPLFVPAQGPQGQQLLQTAQNKLNTFNQQSFPRTKTADTYRIFTLGGSTTYGRPYNDVTSFSSWLRELLPKTDRSKNWEVINAGGISYASYRVAHLMKELVAYQPDLFVIYTGHNEFLEERTYRKIKQIPGPIRSTISLLAKTRTWSAITEGLQKAGIYPEAEPATGQNKLGDQVDAILDRSAGLDRYTRDDSLQDKILEHYQLSLERMVALARSAGAEVVFVTPAANLKDCTPFKSEHTPGLDLQSLERSIKLLHKAKQTLELQNWAAALTLLDQAVVIDPEYAEIHYRRGEALLGLNRPDEADNAFRTARDEDVCPLRALTSMRRIVQQVGREQEITVVDYVGLLEQYVQKSRGHLSPGDELFLDHVHPTIEGHKLLAIELVETMISEGLVQPRVDWRDQAIATATARIESRIDDEAHGRALANLARVLFWAGKHEDAARLAHQAQQIAGQYLQVYIDSASILTSINLTAGRFQEAVQLMYQTLDRAPGAVEISLKLGQTLADPRFMQLEQAAAHLLLVCQQMPTFPPGFTHFGLVMARRGRFEVAQDILTEALRLNPKNARASSALQKLERLVRKRDLPPQKPLMMLNTYPSQTPRKIVQMYHTSEGRPIAHGIEVEFHENGRLKHFLDVMQGQKSGYEMLWDEEGQLLSRQEFSYGQPVAEPAAQ